MSGKGPAGPLRQGSGHRAQGAGRRASGMGKSQRDDSMLDETANPLLFRAKEGIHSLENTISRGNICGKFAIYQTVVPPALEGQMMSVNYQTVVPPALEWKMMSVNYQTVMPTALEWKMMSVNYQTVMPTALNV